MKVFVVCLFAVIAGSLAKEDAVREITQRMYYPGYPTSSVGAVSAGSAGSNFLASNTNADKFIHIKANRQDPAWGLGGWGHPGGIPLYPHGGVIVPGAMVPAPMPIPPVSYPGSFYPHHYPGTWSGVYPGGVGVYPGVYPGGVYPGGVYPGPVYPGGAYPVGGGGAYLEATLAKSASHSSVADSNHMSFINGHAANTGYPGYPGYPYPYYK